MHENCTGGGCLTLVRGLSNTIPLVIIPQANCHQHYGYAIQPSNLNVTLSRLSIDPTRVRTSPILSRV